MKARVLIPIIVVVGIYAYLARQAKKVYQKFSTDELTNITRMIVLARYMQFIKSQKRSEKQPSTKESISEIEYTIN